jgi:hypothetical protein
MTYADYQNTEPVFQDGPSDDPDPITVTLNLTTNQFLTLRQAIMGVWDTAHDRKNWMYVSHLSELLALIDQAAKP